MRGQRTTGWRTTGRRTTARGADDGSVSVLIVGFAIVIALMVVVVTNASSAYLRRQGLDSLADGAALAAGDGLQSEAVYLNGVGDRAALDPVLARVYVAEYLSAVGAGRRYPGLSYRVSATADAVTVQVSAPLDLPFHPPGWERRPVISGTAASYVAVSND